MNNQKPTYYKGNKKIEGIYQKIINNIPLFSIYYELFAGSGAIAKILVGKGVSSQSSIILNDLDHTVNFMLKNIPGSTVINFNALDLIQSELIVSAMVETFIFCDPPYLHSTRSDDQLYKFEMSEVDHVQFLSSLLQLKCNVMVIHPVCSLYDEMLSKWNKIEVKIRYNKKTSLEALYMNYSTPWTIQSTSYLGANCWDRQRIKRKGDRLINKLKQMPHLERQYILDRISQSDFTL